MGEVLKNIVCSEVTKNLLVLIGVIVAVVSILTARSIARKKQSADLLLLSRGDQVLQVGYKHVYLYHNAKDKNIRNLADEMDSDECIAVRYVLNHFETVSIGIRAGIYDEAMLKRSWYTIFVLTYERSLPLINAIREKVNAPTILQEYECLAKKWKKSPLKKISNK